MPASFPRTSWSAIALIMMVSFALSIATLVWDRKHSAAPAPPPGVQLHPVPPTPAAFPGAAAAAPVVVADATRELPTAEPLVISVRNRRRLDEIEGKVENNSGKSLHVDLLSEDRAGAILDRRAFELQPGERQAFSSEQGMQLSAGGTIVARVAGYADQQAQIPE